MYRLTIVKKIHIAILIVAIMLCTGNIAFAALEPVTNVSISGALLKTPSENVFRVAGTEQEFILLDVTDNDESKFLVMAKDFYGNVVFDTDNTQKFDVADPSNIAYKLNNEFITNGFKNGHSIYKLPLGFTEHIDFEHEWVTEAGNYSGNCPNDYTFEAGVSLLSQTELMKYMNKIGIKDSFEIQTSGWWLRTPNKDSSNFNNVIRFGTSYITSVSTFASNTLLGVRPVFYLDKDFFIMTKLSTSDLGKNVKSTIKNLYTQQEFKKIYTDTEIWDGLGYRSDISINVKSAMDADGNNVDMIRNLDYIYANIDITNNTAKDYDVILVSVVYNAKGFPLSANIMDKNIYSKQTDSSTVMINLPDGLQGDEYIKLFLWNKSFGFESISNSPRIF